MKNYFTILILLAIGCNQPKSTARDKKVEHAEMTKSTIKANLKNLAFDVKKDIVCGMPISAGVLDTTQYKGKLYGFCSPECKAEFLKTPKTYRPAK